MTVDNGDVVRVTAKMGILNEDVQNVFHVQNVSAGELENATMHAAIIARLDAAYDELVTLLADEYSFDTIETFNLTKDEPMAETAWPTLTVGDKIDQPLPLQTAALCLFPTPVARSQGRKYIGGFTEDSNSVGSAPSATLLTALGLFVDILIDVWLEGEGELSFGNWSTLYTRFAPWASALVRDVWRTQRRRATGVGS